ncbi:MAG: hypothetical protein ACJ746_28960 [Bryobacteraceae bacterium]
MAFVYSLQENRRQGKNKPQIVTAIVRELLGFAWAIALETEPNPQPQAA